MDRLNRGNNSASCGLDLFISCMTFSRQMLKLYLCYRISEGRIAINFFVESQFQNRISRFIRVSSDPRAILTSFQKEILKLELTSSRNQEALLKGSSFLHLVSKPQRNYLCKLMKIKLSTVACGTSFKALKVSVSVGIRSTIFWIYFSNSAQYISETVESSSFCLYRIAEEQWKEKVGWEWPHGFECSMLMAFQFQSLSCH